MFVIIGFIVVVGSVLLGFVMHGGPIPVLFQWNEFIIIGGAALGSLMVSAPPYLLKQIFGRSSSVIKGDPYSKKEFNRLLATLYMMANVIRKDGLISIEGHVEEPGKSTIFSKNPFLLKQHHLLHFLCDSLRLLITGGITPMDLETLMDTDIETHHRESSAASGIVQKIGDSLPGLGIVAAVLGIIVTMQAIGGPPQEIGLKVAAALVGTFLGVLLSYGFVQPMATNLDLTGQSEVNYAECIKVGILSIAKGYPPAIVTEFARRTIRSDARPSFAEMEEAMRAVKSGG